MLDLTHLEPAHIDAKLPDITEFARTYLGVEPYTEQIPVFPTAHYAMGGIPTNIKGEALANNDDVIPGLYAAGEVACVSVHGANRLGHQLAARHQRVRPPGRDRGRGVRRDGVVRGAARAEPETFVVDLIEGMRNATGDERVAAIRTDLQATMDINAQVYRTEGSLKQALDRHRGAEAALRQRRRAGQGQAVQHRPAGGRRARASCSTWPRCWWCRRWPARSPAAGTSARTTTSATT